MGGSLKIWGRNGFDGDTSGSWLHAELRFARKTDRKNTNANNDFALAA
jgi:hypothetical protein